MWPAACIPATMPSLPPCHAELNPSSLVLLSIGYLITTRRKLVVYHLFLWSTAVSAQFRKGRIKRETRWPVFLFPFCYYEKTLQPRVAQKRKGCNHLTSDSPSSQGSRDRNLSKTMKQKLKGTPLAGCVQAHVQLVFL